MDLSESKILVTGCAGFIGMHTVLRLIENGARIVGLDNINSYYSTSLKEDRLLELGIARTTFPDAEMLHSSFYPNFKFIKLDLENKREISALFMREKFDYVIHLAAQAGVRYSIENPSAYIESNIVGFLNIIEGCRNNNVKHLVYASSSSVYGLNTEIPFSENQKTERPTSLYAATKKSNELMAHAYGHLFHLHTTGLRFFTVYGPWGRPDMALFLFTDKIFNDQPIEVFGDGKMMRDFTYIDDVVDAIVGTVATPNEVTQTDNELSSAPYALYNVGNSSPVPVLQYIQAIEKSLKKKAFMLMRPAHPADVHTTHANITSLENHIGYKPKTKVQDGVQKFVNWYLGYYHSTERAHIYSR